MRGGRAPLLLGRLLPGRLRCGVGAARGAPGHVFLRISPAANYHCHISGPKKCWGAARLAAGCRGERRGAGGRRAAGRRGRAGSEGTVPAACLRLGCRRRRCPAAAGWSRSCRFLYFIYFSPRSPLLSLALSLFFFFLGRGRGRRRIFSLFSPSSLSLSLSLLSAPCAPPPPTSPPSLRFPSRLPLSLSRLFSSPSPPPPPLQVAKSEAANRAVGRGIQERHTPDTHTQADTRAHARHTAPHSRTRTRTGTGTGTGTRGPGATGAEDAQA